MNVVGGHKGIGLAKVLVTSKRTSEEVVAERLIENIQREDLNAIELAEAYQQLVEQFDLTQNRSLNESARNAAHCEQLAAARAARQHQTIGARRRIGGIRALPAWSGKRSGRQVSPTNHRRGPERSSR